MNLDVLIPSLLGPAPIQTPQTQIPPPVVPAIERLLARADRKTGVAATGPSGVFEVWGVNAPYPVAAVLAEYDGLEISTDGWMFAEPVHLVADRDRLVMFSSHFLELDAAESAALIVALNSHFADRGLQFYAPTPERWYVRCNPTDIPSTTSPNSARRRALVDSQPISKGALDWRSLQNETQMLFFDHPVNDARQAKDKPAVSGVWFWGGGVQPQLTKPAYDLIVTDSPLAVQLAGKTGIGVKSLPWRPTERGTGKVLAVIDSCSTFPLNLDFVSWTREIERLDRELFLPVAQALANGIIQRLCIQVPDEERRQTFEITRRNQLHRFWRSTKPLSSYA